MMSFLAEVKKQAECTYKVKEQPFLIFCVLLEKKANTVTNGTWNLIDFYLTSLTKKKKGTTIKLTSFSKETRTTPVHKNIWIPSCSDP